MRLSLLVIAALSLTACEMEEIGTGSGSINVRNADDGTVDVLIADSKDCFAGLRGSVNSKSTRMFSVGEQSYLCVNETKPAFPVNSGGSYVIEGGALRPE
ncbi:MAG TPA: hypothetical protein QGF58_24125 [Myxococcota bacterium]|nr:hypothetical protein [Myxococcota bacterium]